MIRARAVDVVERRTVPLVLESAPMLVLAELPASLRYVGARQLVFEYSRYSRDPWLVESIEIIGTHLCEQDGAWIDTELSARATYTRREDGARPELYMDQLPAWVHKLTRAWLPSATVLPLSHAIRGEA